MSDNLRETYRIDADPELVAELFHEGRVTPCALQNLSAGGAKVTSSRAMPEGAQCTLGVRLGTTLRGSTSVAYVSFMMEVLESTTRPDGRIDLRLRNISEPGSTEYEAASKLVFEAQRRTLARTSGAEPASPMAVDPARRRRMRLRVPARFSRRSLRPDQD